MALVSKLEELYAPIRPELDEVQGLVGTYWHEVLSLVDDSVVAPPKAGGKLMRPALCLLAAGVTGVSDLKPFIPVAAAYELLHMAALIHDDVVDKAALRRGTLSLNAQWDDRRAVLSGDYLVSRATQLLIKTGSCGLVEDAFEAVRVMTEGELSHLANDATEFTQENCIKLASQKTATLFAASCAAVTFIHDEQYRQAFRDYALALGTAFQLVDDILDITQTQDILGKPACGDIAQGKKTLPILFMKEHLQGPELDRLLAMVGHAVSQDDRTWVSSILQTSGALAKTVSIASNLAQEARSAIEALPSSQFRDSMAEFTQFILVRGS